MDENTRKWYGIAAAIIVIFIAVALYLSVHKNAVAPSDNVTGTATTTDQTGSVQTGIPNMSGYTAPNLDRPYTPPSNLPANIQEQSRKTVAAAITQLKIDPNHLAYWLELAIYRKGSADYTGAEEIWVYCTKVWPTDALSFSNLADLYGNYLHDNQKAVANWNQVIKLEPKNIAAYLNLATFQNINMKDKAAAQATLQAGLKANPGNKDLQYALNNL